jgi:hypothetical protein
MAGGVGGGVFGYLILYSVRSNLSTNRIGKFFEEKWPKIKQQLGQRQPGPWALEGTKSRATIKVAHWRQRAMTSTPCPR